MIEKFEEVTKLNESIDGALTVLQGLPETSDEYEKVVDQLAKLMKIKSQIVETHLKVSENEKPDRISKDTLAVIGANLVGIAMIIGYERANIIASKALGFIMRSR